MIRAALLIYLFLGAAFLACVWASCVLSARITRDEDAARAAAEETPEC
ncbi:hypothetical protein [uncultured Deinococcus sp.]|nr:hypothetical protein [uncultured Deinococcus sp.]